MSIVSVDEIRDFLDDITDEKYYDEMQPFHDSIEREVKNACRKDFEETTYSLSRYDGTGTNWLSLDNYPIITLDRVSIGTLDAIKIRNTAEATSASVSVTSTGIRLVKDGTADTTALFATYTTMTTLVDAINAIGNSWEAQLITSDYASITSSELFERFGANALDNNWVYLEMPEEPQDDIIVYKNRGQIYCHGGFPEGNRNIIVDYSAGYDSDDMPEDIKLAIKILVKYFYQRQDEEVFGTADFTTGDISANFEKGVLPKEVLRIINRYKRRMV